MSFPLQISQISDCYNGTARVDIVRSLIRQSLSAIVTMALFAGPILQALLAAKVAITVSLPSFMLSFLGVTVIVAVIAPLYDAD